MTDSTAGPVAPPCPHFGVCGGCTAQDMAPERYRTWKRALVTDALTRHGLDPAVVAEPVSVAPQTRRTARFGARGGVLGFTERGGHALVEVPHCKVLAPPIVAALPILHALARIVAPGRGFVDVPVTLAATGLDVVLRGPRAPDGAARQALAAQARRAGLARVSWQAAGSTRREVAGAPEPVATFRPVWATFAGVAVDLPPAAFLQPTEEGEAALAHQVVATLTGARRVADLYAGCGPFAFALAAKGAQVRAVEGDPAMAGAIEAAARRAQAKVTAEARDLVKRPLTAVELDRLDGLVLDPPRSGAARQVAEIARSKISAVAYISCNPQTFARDAKTLVDGGYRLARVAPVDQFLWSAHVELAAAFVR
jgi:23S rRNA (uracil1939-C5)-methyltransferase